MRRPKNSIAMHVREKLVEPWSHSGQVALIIEMTSDPGTDLRCDFDWRTQAPHRCLCSSAALAGRPVIGDLFALCSNWVADNPFVPRYLYKPCVANSSSLPAHKEINTTTWKTTTARTKTRMYENNDAIAQWAVGVSAQNDESQGLLPLVPVRHRWPALCALALELQLETMSGCH